LYEPITATVSSMSAVFACSVSVPRYWWISMPALISSS